MESNIIYAKGASHSLNEFLEMGYEVLSLDSSTDPSDVISSIKSEDICFQGNLDPGVLYADSKSLHELAHKMLEKFEGYRHIVNLGQDMYPDTPVEGIAALVNEVKSYYGVDDDVSTSH